MPLDGDSNHSESASGWFVGWGGEDGGWSLALEGHTYISTFGMAARVLIVTNVAVFLGIDGVIFP